MANTQLYVLDEQQRLVPRGVMGELWIGGDGLAIDYWQRPDLTDAQFRTLPSLPNAGRLYRTGDKVCLRMDGRLTHHGRLDFKSRSVDSVLNWVKLRMFSNRSMVLQMP